MNENDVKRLMAGTLRRIATETCPEPGSQRTVWSSALWHEADLLDPPAGSSTKPMFMLTPTGEPRKATGREFYLDQAGIVRICRHRESASLVQILRLDRCPDE